MTQGIREELGNRIITLKIQLAIVMEKLVERKQESFARHLYMTLRNMYAELDGLNSNDLGTQRKRRKNITGYLTELENILLACKVGIGLPDEEKALEMVRTLRTEVSEQVTQEEVQMN